MTDVKSTLETSCTTARTAARRHYRQADRRKLKVIHVALLGLPAELRIPVHGVNVEEHGATGVGDVCAVDASVPASRQALQKITPCITSVHQML